jgi:hypothetical protein
VPISQVYSKIDKSTNKSRGKASRYWFPSTWPSPSQYSTVLGMKHSFCIYIPSLVTCSL